MKWPSYSPATAIEEAWWKWPGAELVGEVDGVLGAVDVEPAVALLVGGHVVDRREVEEVLDARERLPVLLGDPEQRL